MNKVLVIGCGGVANVAIQKMCFNKDIFNEIIIASRSLDKPNKLKKELSKYNVKIAIDKVDAFDVSQLVNIINKYKPNLVVNLALPYQDLSIMEACLVTKVNYLDTANYESLDEAKFEYKQQWDYDQKYKENGIMALLGCGFDPGMTGVYAAFAQKHYFDTIEYIDILDANGGDNGYPFVTNFNPEINIREVTANGSYFENGKFIHTKPLEIKRNYNFDGIGEKDMYLIHHEELESLAINIKGVKRIRFFMTFSQNYLTHLKCLENVGMTSIKSINYEGKEIIPLQFLKAVLPNPADLGAKTKGNTNIGIICIGQKDNKPVKYQIYNICSHENCYKETYSQAVAYTTGVPAMTGAAMMLKKTWNKIGVHNVEEFDPDPFLEFVSKNGLPYKENFNPQLID